MLLKFVCARVALQCSPLELDPESLATKGLKKDPVVVLDFASM